MSANLPDAGKTVFAGGIETNYHDEGSGRPLILLHGSGPGVTAWQNWSGVLPRLAKNYRVIAPDIVGFGLTKIPDGHEPNIKSWLAHVTGLIDALELSDVTLVGNSFGGAISLAMMLRYSERVQSLVLMGTPAGEFQQTQGLGDSYSFELSREKMAEMMTHFPYDPTIVTGEMIDARFASAAVNSGIETIRKLQPKPSDDGSPATVRGVPLEQLEKIEAPALILHGREDGVIPLDVAVRMHRHLKNSEMHVFGQCGHWVQIEKEDAFVQQLENFLEGRAKL